MAGLIVGSLFLLTVAFVAFAMFAIGRQYGEDSCKDDYRKGWVAGIDYEKQRRQDRP